MKRKKYMLLAGMLMLLLFALTGCSDTEEDRLEDEVERLEQQVTDLQKEKGSGTAAEETQTETQDYAALETAVNAQVEKMDAAVAEADEAKKVEQYFALKKEAEALDRQLDAYDDYLEGQYRNNAITMEELRTQERNLDMLEEKLDMAEDQLEVRFGIDD